MSIPDHQDWLEQAAAEGAADAGAAAPWQGLDGVAPNEAAADLRLHLQLQQHGQAPAAQATIDWAAVTARTEALTVEEDRALRTAAEESARAQRRAPTAEDKRPVNLMQQARRRRWAWVAAAVALFGCAAAYQLWMAPQTPALRYGETARVPSDRAEIRYVLPTGARVTVYGGGEVELKQNPAGLDQIRQAAGRVAYDFGHTATTINSPVGVIAGQDARAELQVAGEGGGFSTLTVQQGRVLIVSIRNDGYSISAGETAYMAGSGAVKIVPTGSPVPVFDLPLPMPGPAVVQPFHPVDLPGPSALLPTTPTGPVEPPAPAVTEPAPATTPATVVGESPTSTGLGLGASSAAGGGSTVAATAPGQEPSAPDDEPRRGPASADDVAIDTETPGVASAPTPATGPHRPNTPPVDDLPPSDFEPAQGSNGKGHAGIHLPHTPAPAGNNGNNSNNGNGNGNGGGNNGNSAASNNGWAGSGNSGLHLGSGNSGGGSNAGGAGGGAGAGPGNNNAGGKGKGH